MQMDKEFIKVWDEDLEEYIIRRKVEVVLDQMEEDDRENQREMALIQAYEDLDTVSDDDDHDDLVDLFLKEEFPTQE